MPKSRIRTKKGRATVVTKADRKRLENAFYRKVDEYVALTWEEIEKVKSGKLSRVYSSALEEAVKQKEAIDSYTKNKTDETLSLDNTLHTDSSIT